MSKRKTKRSSQQMGENLRLNPQLRLCPKFDPEGPSHYLSLPPALKSLW